MTNKTPKTTKTAAKAPAAAKAPKAPKALKASAPAGLKVVVFDENGPHDLGEQSPDGVHNVIAEALGEPMLAPHAEAEIDRVEAELVAKHADSPVAPIGDVVGALLTAPAGSVVDIVSGEVHAKPPAVQIARKPAKAPKAATAPKAPKAAKAPKSDELPEDQRKLLVALLHAEVFGDKPVDERIGQWVRAASVHKSSQPHGLPMGRIPGLMGGLKRRGLVECGWDKAATVRLTPAGLAASKAR